MSFSGYQSHAQNLLVEPKDPYSGVTKMKQQRNRRKLTFTQIVNLCAAFQFGIFTFVSRSMQRALQYTKRRRIKVFGVYSAGEMSENEALRLEFERISKKYGVKVV